MLSAYHAGNWLSSTPFPVHDSSTRLGCWLAGTSVHTYINARTRYYLVHRVQARRPPRRHCTCLTPPQQEIQNLGCTAYLRYGILTHSHPASSLRLLPPRSMWPSTTWPGLTDLRVGNMHMYSAECVLVALWPFVCACTTRSFPQVGAVPYVGTYLCMYVDVYADPRPITTQAPCRSMRRPIPLPVTPPTWRSVCSLAHALL